MKPYWLLFFVTLLGAVSISVVPAFAQTNLSDAKIQAILKQRIDQEKQSVGIVVGFINDKGSRTISYGNLDQTSTRKPDGDTVFEIGSITKVFTSLLLADMAKRGELNLDDAIAQFLPESVQVLTKNSKEITLLNLANHTSGLPRLPNNFEPKDLENPYADYTVEQLYSFLSNYSLTREIGAKYEYSNLGTGLLGHILSLKSGTDYETLVTTRIAQPLGMDSTRIQLSPEMQKRFATGHNQSGTVVKNWDFPTLAGAGALRSTANDLLKFLAVNLRFTQSNLLPVMQATYSTSQNTDIPDVKIGLGWHVLTKHGTEIVWHNGGTGGYRSFIGFDSKQKTGVVVLSNSANDVDDIGLHLLNQNYKLVKRTPPKQRQAIALNPKIYDAYIGQYQLAPKFILTITKENDKLYAQATDQPKVELFPEAETQFFIKEVDAQVTFVKDKQGQVTHLILYQAGQNLQAKKIQ